MIPMTPWLVVGAGFLSLAVTTTTWHRAMNGKPRAFWILMGLCVASGVWRTATNGVLTWPWMLSAIGLISGLAALVMFTARHSR